MVIASFLSHRRSCFIKKKKLAKTVLAIPIELPFLAKVKKAASPMKISYTKPALAVLARKTR